MPPARSPILIAGPTASGKSALAVALAQACGGMVINADSMQVYRELRVLTARPSADEEALVPHALFGHVPASEAYSVARWLEDVRGALARARSEGLRPILVGGTGLYFKALSEGLSPVPPIPPEVRTRWRKLASEEGAAGLHAALSRLDPVMAARLAPTDAQRLTRALEVFEATGRSLADWQRQAGSPSIDPEQAVRIVVRPPRAELHARAKRRLERMVEEGALEEVRALMQLDLAPALPALRALGVAAFAEHLHGRAALAAALERALVETRQYIKRQETWARQHMIAWSRIHETVSCENAHQYMQFIDEGGDRRQ